MVPIVIFGLPHSLQGGIDLRLHPRAGKPGSSRVTVNGIMTSTTGFPPLAKLWLRQEGHGPALHTDRV